jgi:putative transposase
LLVRDQGGDEIAASIQLIEGRTAQPFNRRKGRAGAFWQDRYHATAVETGEHLARCLVYIDLNMVRAGVVGHPVHWEVGGYHEIQRERLRCRIVDRKALAEALGVELPRLADAHGTWVSEALRNGRGRREPLWTESVAVGGREFVERVQAELGARGRHREIERSGDVHILRESSVPYTAHSEFENTAIGQK